MNSQNDNRTLASIYQELCGVIAELDVEQIKIDVKRDRAMHLKNVLERFLREELRATLSSSSCTLDEDDLAERLRRIVHPD